MAQELFSESLFNSSGSSRARTELAKKHFTEFSAFTGTDIKAFILPQGDQLARQEMERRLRSLDASLQNLSEDINSAQIRGDIIETLEVSAKNPGVARGLQHDILPLLNLQSITISTFRAKTQVRALGHVNARGLARGSRTVAGTFILTEFSRDSFWDILTAPYRDINVGDSNAVLPDQMRPFDIMLLYAHEMGNIGIRHIYGLEIVTNGVVYSVQDYYAENTISYIAQDVTPLIPLAPAFDGDDKWASIMETTGYRNTKINNLITNLRGEIVGQDFQYLKNTRNPFK